MKLFLTSTGLTSNKLKKEFLKLAGNPKNLEVLLMYGATTDKQMQYVQEAQNQLTNLGFDKSNIYHINFSQDKIKLPSNFQMIYFCGGNTFYILDRVKKLKLDKVISDFIKKDGLYLGVSAGSIIVGPSIEIAGYGSEGDENSVNLKDTKGLNITSLAVYPHYRLGLRGDVKEFSKKVDYPLTTIKDNQALLILNNEMRKI